MTFYAEKFRKLRKKQKLSMKEVCQKADIGNTRLWQWETGTLVPPDIKIRRLASAINVSVDKISNLEPETDALSKELSLSARALDLFAKEFTIRREHRVNDIISGISYLNKELKLTSIIIDVLFSNLNAAFYIKGNNLKYITGNDTFLRYLNLSKDLNIRDYTDEKLFVAKEAMKNKLQDEEVVNTGQPIVNMEGFIPGSRKKRWGIISKYPFRDSEDRIAGVIGTFVDITKRKRAERMRELLESSLRTTKDVVWIKEIEETTGKKKRTVFISEAIIGLSGYPPENYYNDPDFCKNTCLGSRLEEKQNKQLKENHGQAIFQYEIIKKSGEKAFIETRATNRVIDGKTYVCGIDRDITIAKEMEKQRELLEASLNTAEDVVWVKEIKPEKKTIFISEGVLNLTGYSPEKYYNDTNFWKKNCLDSRLEEKQNKQLKENHGQAIFQYEIIKKSGEKAFIETRVTSRIIDGKTYICGIDRDITIVKEMEKTRELLEASLNSADDVVWINELEPEEKTIFMSDSITWLTGYPPEKYYKDPYFWSKICVNGKNCKKRKRVIRDMTEKWKDECEITKSDGKKIWIETRVTAKLIDGKPYLCGITRDITHVKRTEELKELLKLNVENMTEAIAIIDEVTHEYLYLNMAREKLYGYPNEMFFEKGLDFRIEKCIYPDDKYRLKESYEKNIWGDEDNIFRIVRPDGEVRWVESNYTKTTFLGRKCVMSIQKDITVKQKRESKINKLMHYVNNMPGTTLWIGKFDTENNLVLDFITDNIEKLTGCSKEHYLDKPVPLSFFVDDSQKDLFEDWMKEKQVPAKFEHLTANSNGEKRRVITRIDEVEDPGKEHQYICTISENPD